MASSCGMLATCSMDGATSAMELGSVHQDGIAVIGELLREVERSRDPVEAHRVVRQSIARIMASEPFQKFIRTTKRADGQQWPVAFISAERARRMGLPERAYVVRLSSQSVDHRQHQERWSGFSVGDWDRIQRIVDKGKWHRDRTRHCCVWLKNGAKFDLVVIKRTKNNEIFMVTYHRAGERYIKKLKSR